MEKDQLPNVINLLNTGENILQFQIFTGHLAIGANLYICYK